MKKILYYLLMIVILIVAFETLSALFFNIMKCKFTFHKTSSYLIAEDKVEYVKNHYDRDLGWLPFYPTKFGERPRKEENDNNLVASFGDSFTHCAEVKNNESWQEYLATLTGANVYNFGVDGYGPDQALLRFRKEYPQVKTKIVTLGIISENINRIVNNYRKFLGLKTNIPATKPRFILNGGQLILQPNPIQRKEDVNKLLDENFLSEIGKNDYWYSLGDLPVLNFPYTKILFNRFFWSEVIHKVRKQSIDEIRARPSTNLWADKKSVKLMMSILDSFVEEAKLAGATPIIILFPMRDDVKSLMKKNKNTEAVEKIVTYCKEKNYYLFNGVNTVFDAANTEKQLDSYFEVVHVSAKGNSLIAEQFLKYLKDEDLYENKK